MLRRANAQEQKALGDSVEDDQKDCRPDGFRRADTCASRDQAEVRDSGVRQHALAVCLRDGHERAQQERQAANQDNHDATGADETA